MKYVPHEFITGISVEVIVTMYLIAGGKQSIVLSGIIAISSGCLMYGLLLRGLDYMGSLSYGMTAHNLVGYLLVNVSSYLAFSALVVYVIITGGLSFSTNTNFIVIMPAIIATISYCYWGFNKPLFNFARSALATLSKQELIEIVPTKIYYDALSGAPCTIEVGDSYDDTYYATVSLGRLMQIQSRYQVRVLSRSKYIVAVVERK